MTEFYEEVEFDLYEGEPDDRPRHIEGIQDDGDEIKTFVAPDQRNTAETIAWYDRNRTEPPFDPDGMCLKVCRYARNIGSMYASAKEAQDNTPEQFRVYSVDKLEIGSVVYFDTMGDSNPFGHIGTLVGRIKTEDQRHLSSLVVETNSVKANQLVKVRGDYFGRYWGDKFTFGATWLNGQELKMPRISEPVVEKPTSSVIHMMLAPLQFSDTLPRRESDIKKIMARAAKRKVAWVWGTEAAEKNTRVALRDACAENGYRLIWRGPNDSWVAIRRSIIAGNVDVQYDPIVAANEGVGTHGPRGVLAVSFDMENVGRVSLLGTHYLLQGQPDPAPEEKQVNLELNKRLAREVSRLARELGEGKNKVFYGGDQNIRDRTDDTFLGGPLTSAQDELQKWEDSGHGSTNVIASYDADRGVSATYVRVQDDDEFPLHGDHYVTEAGYNVKVLN
jgi:hypothetical protein